MPADTSALIPWLQAFNRKERYWLLRQAIGAPFRSLSEDFRQNLADTLGEAGSLPSDAWWAFDYHLDWIALALHLVAEGRTPSDDDSPDPIRADGAQIQHLMEGNQQDADLLVASGNQLVIVETKGAASWTRDQMDVKLTRLGQLYRMAQKVDVELHLVLCSPNDTGVHRPGKKRSEPWDAWALAQAGSPRHMPLSMSPSLIQPTRIDKISGKTYGGIAFRRGAGAEPEAGDPSPPTPLH